MKLLINRFGKYVGEYEGRIPAGHSIVNAPVPSAGSYWSGTAFVQYAGRTPHSKSYRKLITNGELFSPKYGLTGDEQRRIEAYAANNANPMAADVYAFINRVKVEAEVNLAHPDAIEAFEALTLLSDTDGPLLMPERVAKILRGIEA